MEYLLGTGAEELARLEFQHRVWGGITAAFLDRLGIVPGSRVLDVGSGPGLVSLELADRVGPEGRVVALDASARWRDHIAAEIGRRGGPPIEPRLGLLDEVELEAESFDLVFARWVFSFLPDPARAVARLARALKPGGVLAVQDYNHEGVSLFPDSPGFRAAVRALRAWYQRAGGDPWVVGRLPRDFRAAGLETREIVPHVLAGPPGSPAHRWADVFFPVFARRWVEEGLLSPQEERDFRTQWEERKLDPDALFCSPIVVDLAARKPLSRPSPAP